MTSKPKKKPRTRSKAAQLTKKQQAAIAEVAKAKETVNLRWKNKNARIAMVDELTLDGWSQRQIVRAVAKQHDISPRTVWDDVAEAEARRAPADKERRETVQTKAADTWERLAYEHLKADDRAAANYAWDRWCKVMGAYAPRKLEINTSVNLQVSVRAVMAVLDEQGIAALELVLQQVEAAKQRGELAPVPVAPEADPEDS